MSNDLNLFKFEKISNFASSIYSVKIANKNVIAITKNILLRFSIDDPNNFEEIRVPCENDLAQNIFLDPSGCHVLICMQSGISFYLAKNSKKFRSIKESKGLLIESVGWNMKHCSESSTGFILLGTSSGELIETKFINSTSILELQWKVIHKLDQGITGITFDCYPDSNSKYFLILTTSTNLYPRFFDLSYVMKGYHLFTTEFEKINEFPAGSKCTTFPMQFGYSYLDIFYPKNKLFPGYLAWMNGAGVYCANFNAKTVDAETNLFIRPCLLHYNQEVKCSMPITVAASEFHVIFQYSNMLNFISIINEETVYSLSMDSLVKEKALGLCKDITNGRIYLFTNTNLFRINCDDETKTIWKVFLNQKNYDLAYQYCSSDEERNIINVKHARALYSDKKFCDAALLYAETNEAFEETVSLFIDLETKEPLKKYLLAFNLRKSPSNQSLKNTYDVISMWLLELFFEDIITENFKSDLDITNDILKHKDSDYKTFVENPDIISSLKRNKHLIYEKIKIYGDSTQSAIFAEIINDRDKIIENLIEKGNFEEALKILSKEKTSLMHYKYGAKIIGSLPKELIDSWITLSHTLDPKKVLPIIRNIDDSLAKKYVKYVIMDLKSDYEEIHNFYILLCAKLESPKSGVNNGADLIAYLESQGDNCHDTKYDPTLALRICMEYQHLEGSVFLHSLLNKNKEAVKLALSEKNVELAKKVATKFYGPEEVKKNLWLKIARFIIEEEDDVHEACRLVKSQHILKLEDILPYFPDYVKIEQFSEAICDSLDYYESHMSNLKADMKMSTEYADKNREEINMLKQKPLIIQENSMCCYCSELLTSRGFCVFTCGHCFHLHCLELVVEPMLSEDSKSLYCELKDKLAHNTYNDPGLKNDLQGLLTEDCCYCGSLAIENVDKPVLTFNDFETDMKLWR